MSDYEATAYMSLEKLKVKRVGNNFKRTLWRILEIRGIVRVKEIQYRTNEQIFSIIPFFTHIRKNI